MDSDAAADCGAALLVSEAWLDAEATQGDPDGACQLVQDWEAEALDKPRAAKLFETALNALVEHYDEYRDYNTTTTQSDGCSAG